MTNKNKRHIAVLGLGYVGLPVAVAFGSKQPVIAFDVNEKRIAALKQGIDHTHEITKDMLESASLLFTTDANDLKRADFYIIAVPTPVNLAKQPDFGYLIAVSKTLGPFLKRGDIVVYESTVYPGATEEVCGPILEQTSGLKSGVDFFLGYSPERINPGDKARTFTKITKVVSGQTADVLDVIADVYGSVVTAGVHRASSIRVAEAAKVIENTQRDLNIAFVNELAVIFNRLQIDTDEVLKAAATKWNFINFKPGLVGGHCIGVDPYYLTHKASMSGIHTDVILSGRRINDHMGKYIAAQTVKQITLLGKPIAGARVGILGLTFKENCSDIRNTKIIDIVDELRSFQMNVLLHDALADHAAAKHEYNVTLSHWDDLQALDALILAVPHQDYLSRPLSHLVDKLAHPRLMVDVKSVFDKKQLEALGVTVWRL